MRCNDIFIFPSKQTFFFLSLSSREVNKRSGGGATAASITATITGRARRQARRRVCSSELRSSDTGTLTPRSPSAVGYWSKAAMGFNYGRSAGSSSPSSASSTTTVNKNKNKNDVENFIVRSAACRKSRWWWVKHARSRCTLMGKEETRKEVAKEMRDTSTCRGFSRVLPE